MSEAHDSQSSDNSSVLRRQALKELLSRPLDGLLKGAPHAAPGGAPLTAASIARQKWSLLHEDLPLPAAVLRRTALQHNLRWMQAYARARGALLAPHGKTTLAPQLFDLQLRLGAWGITVATAQQLRVCRRFGIQKVFMANQLTGRSDIEYVRDELAHDAGFEFFCLVDTVAGVERLVRHIGPHPARALDVLIEVGLPGGRGGCRHLEDAMAVAHAVTGAGNLRLRGVECFEGIAVSDDADADGRLVGRFFDLFAKVYRSCRAAGCFDPREPVILSAGGSIYFDVVVRELRKLARGDARILLRSGCYLAHDSGFYQRQAGRFDQRSAALGESPMDLRPALEIWGQVQSTPEPGLAIVNVGKRDVSHDIDPPRVHAHFRPGTHPAPLPAAEAWTVRALHDQHICLARMPHPLPVADADASHQRGRATTAATGGPGIAAEPELAVGDLVGFGISHPCTTFDKWRLIWMVDDDYRVLDAIRTFF